MKKPRLEILYPYPQGEAPSQRFRIEQYIPELQKEFDVRIRPYWSKSAWKILYKKGHYFQKFVGLILGFAKRKLWLLSAISADFIYIHREATPIGPPFVEWILTKILRKKLIYDFDDAIWLPNQSEANRGLVKNLKYHGKVRKVCKWSHKVSVGNEYLANYARKFNDNVHVIPTTVDAEGLHNNRIHPKDVSLSAELAEVSKGQPTPIIGWTGTHSTFHQLEIIWPILDEIIRKTPFTFHIISDSFPEMLPDYVKTVFWKKESEIEELLKFDIGIMPLKDNEWEKGKCGFKLIQYMALEIPPMASDIGVNSEIINNSDLGVLVPYNDSEDWKQGLRKLLNDATLRKKMGEEGRKRIVEAYSIKANMENVMGLFS